MNEPNKELETYPFVLLTDIHADQQSLERVLDDIPEVRYKVFLGDAVGYGNNPNQLLNNLETYLM
jgi:hypothetical protein